MSDAKRLRKCAALCEKINDMSRHRDLSVWQDSADKGQVNLSHCHKGVRGNYTHIFDSYPSGFVIAYLEGYLKALQLEHPGNAQTLDASQPEADQPE